MRAAGDPPSVHPGPDTDALGREYREVDDVHLNAKGTRAAAVLWTKVLVRDIC